MDLYQVSEGALHWQASNSLELFIDNIANHTREVRVKIFDYCVTNFIIRGGFFITEIINDI